MKPIEKYSKEVKSVLLSDYYRKVAIAILKTYLHLMCTNNILIHLKINNCNEKMQRAFNILKQLKNVLFKKVKCTTTLIKTYFINKQTIAFINSNLLSK